jgi:hypothetical protein
MKKIINGKMYNTETAKKIGYDNDNPTGNWAETLYQKRTGEFFIQHWDIWNGDCITPISFKDAQKWLEDHGSAEQYAAVFGEPNEDAEDVLLGIRVTAAAAAKLKLKAAETGKTQSAILNELISKM